MTKETLVKPELRTLKLVERFKKAAAKDNKYAGIDTASNLAANWHYLDFIDPKTGDPCLLFEWLFGCRGLLSGRVLKIEAEHSVGKSSFLFLLYGMFQKTASAYCFHEESENAPQPPDYIAAIGCNPDGLIIQQPGSIEACMAAVENNTSLVREDDPNCEYPLVFGLDSISNFGSDVEMEGDITHMPTLDLTKQNAGLGAHARCLSKWFRERGGCWMEANKILLMVTAQLKDKIVTGQGPTMYLTDEQKKGTLAEKPLNYSSSYRVVLKTTPLRDKNTRQDLGEMVHIKTTKNKLSPKYREVQIPLLRGKGFEFAEPTVDMLKSLSPIQLPDGSEFAVIQKGAWISYNDKNHASNPEGKVEILHEIYSDNATLMALREALRIRGFGFKFETNYMPSNVEAEDNDTSVETN